MAIVTLVPVEDEAVAQEVTLVPVEDEAPVVAGDDSVWSINGPRGVVAGAKQAGRDVANTYQGLAARAGGMMANFGAAAKGMAGDALNAVGVENTWPQEAKEARLLNEQVLDYINTEEYPVQSGVGQAIRGAADSTVMMAPGMAAGPLSLATRVGAAALRGTTVSPVAVRAGMDSLGKIMPATLGMQTGVDQYGKKRAQDVPVLPAALSAGVTGAAEYGFERVSTDALLNVITGGANNFTANLGKYFGKEIATELPTTVVQSLADLLFDKDVTPQEAAMRGARYLANQVVTTSSGEQHQLGPELVDTAAQTAIQVGMTGAGGRVAGMAWDGLTKKPGTDGTNGTNESQVSPATAPASAGTTAPASAGTTAPASDPLVDDFEGFDEMPEPRGPLARAAAQVVPAGPVMDPLAAGSDLPSMLLNDSDEEVNDDGDLSGVSQEIGGAPQALSPVRGEDVKEVTLTPVEEENPYSLPGLSRRMAELTGAEESPENVTLAQEFLAAHKNLPNLAPSFQARLLETFVTKKKETRVKLDEVNPVAPVDQPKPITYPTLARDARALGLTVATKNKQGLFVVTNDEKKVIGQMQSLDEVANLLDGWQAAEASPPLPAPKVKTAKQLAAQKARNTINPASDDLLMAIRKLGGLDKAQVMAQWGKKAVESDYLKRQAIVGKPVLRNKAGLPLDRMLTSLKGHGYLPQEASLRDFEELFLRSAAGEAVLTEKGDERAADAYYEAEMARLVEEMEAGQAQELVQEIDPAFASLVAGAPELAGMTPEALEWTTDVFNDILDGGFLLSSDDYLRSILEESDNEGNYTGRSQGAASQAAAGAESQGSGTAATGVDAETEAAGVRSEVTPAGDQLKMFATPPTFGRKSQPKGPGVASLDLSLAPEEAGLFDAAQPVAEPVAPKKKNAIRSARIKNLENKLENGQLQTGNMAELNRLHAIDNPAPAREVKLPDSFGADNKLFTADKAEKARAILRAKLNQLNAGIDPEMITAGIDLAGYYVEGGFRTFKAYSDKMVEDLGESIRPFLKSFYLAVRNYPGFDNKGMNSEAGIDELLAVVQVEQAIAAPKVKSTLAEKLLRGDYGVKSIDAYTPAGAKAKAEFLKDARDYLKAVGKVLSENGFSPEKVSVNESGVAGSGEVSLVAFKEGSEYGAYVTIGGSALNFGGAPPSGLQIMYRDNTRKSKYSGGSNRWDAKWDVTSGELAARMVAAAEQAETVAGRKSVAAPAPATAVTPAPADADKNEVNPVANAPEDGIISTDIPKKESQNDGPLRGSGQELSQGAEAGDAEGVEGSGGTGELLLATGDSSDQPTNPTRRVSRSGGVGGRRNSAGGPAGLLSDYKITAADRLGKGGAKQKFADNIAAIETLRQIQAEDREATPDEQAILVRYVGWGGLQQAFPPVGKGWENEARQLKELLSQSDYEGALRSTQDAHYTSDKVIAGIYKAMARLGFKGGKVLEPSVGTGNFLGLMPAAMKSRSRFTGVELDPTTSAIASLLYPQQTLLNMGFQELTIAPNSFDAAIGNPPFGSQTLFDPAYKSLKSFSIHNFFFAKSIEALRPGGVLAMVVSNSLMDKQGATQRQWMAERTELLGAIRLPNNAFKENAGTEVTTDLIFLRKLAPGEQAGKNRWTELQPVRVDGVTYQVNEYFVRHPEMMLGKIVPNKLRFAAVEADEYRGASGLEAPDGFNFEEAVAAAIAKLPENVYVPGKTIAAVQQAKIIVPAPGFARPYGYAMDQEGRAVRRLMDVNGVPEYELVTYGNEPIEGKRLERYKGMLAVRDAVRVLIRAEMNDDPDMGQLRKDLNTTYDAFVAKHGYISDTANASILQDDPTDFPLLKSLEHKYDKGVSATEAKKNGVEAAPSSAQKAAIFRVRTREPYRQATSADSAKDGLMIVLRENGWVDLARIQSLTGQSEQEVLTELRGMVFKVPESGAYETADTYLSGNVKKKLAAALKAAAGDSAFAANVEELQKVQPADIEAEEIFVKLGSHWIPTDVYEAFFREAAGAAVKVRYNRDLGHWSFGDSDIGRPSSRFDSPAMSAYEIIEKLIVGNSIAIYSKDSKGERVFDKEATMQANEKAAEIEREFATWLWTDFDRRDRLAKIYNSEINTSVDPKFDGGHMIFPGMGIISPSKGRDDQLREHQKNGIWRLVQKGYGLLDHVVGAGKTFASIATGLEMKRMGLIRKPMYVVPNHLVGQWAEDFQRLYPGANILVITKKDFSKKNRQEFMGRIATGDWDAVVVAHSSFGFIPAPVEFERRFYADMIAQYEAAIRQMEIEEGKTKSRSTKDMEKSKDKLKEKLKALADRETDNVVDFSEIGVDAVFVDEMHNFKNLFYVTKHTRGVAGLGDINGSKKAFDMFVKTRYLASENKGRGVFSMTGTPVSNSIAEMYTMMRYHEYEALEEMGIHHFDQWANLFADISSDWELDPTGTRYRLQARFRQFTNIPEMMKIYRGFADVVSQQNLRDMAKARGGVWPIPDVSGGKPQNVVVERSELQARYMDYVIYRMDHMPSDKKLDNPLTATTDAMKAALDMRLIDPSLPDHPGSKINTAAKNIVATYQKWNEQKGTQLVFCDLSVPSKERARLAKDYDALIEKAGTLAESIATERNDEKRVDLEDELAQTEEKINAYSPADIAAFSSKFSVYDDLKTKLVAQGIPAHQIAFIHDANTDLQKDALFAKVKQGKVRVLIGSTMKMGAGMNVQDKLVALHHIDAPWRPSDLEQREGRIIRQGNEFFEAALAAGDPSTFSVDIVRYATKETLDARRWQVLEGKAIVVEQLRASSGMVGRKIEDIGGEAENSAEMKAAASGNPLILEEIQLRREIEKIEILRRGWNAAKARYHAALRDATTIDNRADEEIAKIHKDVAKVKAHPHRVTSDEWSIAVEEKTFKAKLKALTGDAKAQKEIAKQNDESVALNKKRAATEVLTQVKDILDKKIDDVGITYRGFDVNLSRGIFGSLVVKLHHSFQSRSEYGTISQSETIYYGEEDKFSASGFFTRLDNLIDGFAKNEAELVAAVEKERAQVHAAAAVAKKEINKPFERDEEYTEKLARHKEVLGQLRADDSKAKTQVDTSRFADFADQRRRGPQLVEDDAATDSDALEKGVALYDITSALPLALKELGKLAKAGAESLPHLITVGRAVHAKGVADYRAFVAGMKAKLGALFERFKGQMLRVWHGVLAKVKEERGSLSNKPVGLGRELKTMMDDLKGSPYNKDVAAVELSGGFDEDDGRASARIRGAATHGDGERQLFAALGYGNSAVELGEAAYAVARQIASGEISKAEALQAFANSVQHISQTTPDGALILRDIAAHLRTLGHDIPNAGLPAIQGLFKAIGAARQQAQRTDSRYSTVRQTVMAGDSGLGKVTITPAKSLPFIGKALAKENAEQVVVKGGNVEALRKVAQGFGKNIIFFRMRDASGVDVVGREAGGVRLQSGGAGNAADAQRAGGGAILSANETISGFINPAQPNLIFLNVDAPNHLLYIAGHEVGHALKMQDSALWAEMEAELQPLIRNWSNYRERMPVQYETLSESDKQEELLADVIGHHFLNENFWSELAQENKTFFTRIAKKAVELLNKALRLLTGLDVRTYISDMTQARAIIAKTLLKYGENVNKGMYGKFAEQADLEYLDNRLMGQEMLAHLRASGFSEETLRAAVGLGPVKLAVRGKQDLPPTLTIDGVERPTMNSNGKPLAQTEEAVRNFWKWFGESKVVDEQGRPLVVYHGSKFNADIKKFSPSKVEQDASEHGFYFTDNPNHANDYATNWGDNDPLEDGAGIYAAYLKSEKPYTSNAHAWNMGWDISPASSRRKGSDGYIIDNHNDGTTYVVYKSSQIKSAIGNKGDFDAASADIRYAIQQSATQVNPSGVLEKIKNFLNPLDYARLRRNVEKNLSPETQHVIGFIAQTPYWKQAEADPAAKPFYVEGRVREEERMDYNVRMRGGMLDGDGRPVSAGQKIKDWFNWNDDRTAWEEMKRQQYYPLSTAEKSALDLLVVEGDARRVEYSSLAKALQNPALKAAGVNAKVFTFYRQLLATQDRSFDIALDIEREIMEEMGWPKELIDKSIAQKRELGKARVEFAFSEDDKHLTATTESGGLNVLHQMKKIAHDFGTKVTKEKTGGLSIVFPLAKADAAKEALTHVVKNRIRGRMHRNHGEGMHNVAVHRVIERLDFDVKSVTLKSGKPGAQFYLPFYPGNELAEKIEDAASAVGGSFMQEEGTGRILILVREELSVELQESLDKIELRKPDGTPKHKVMVYSRYVATEGAAEKLQRDVEKDYRKAMPINYRAGDSYETTTRLSSAVTEEEYGAAVTSSMALDHITDEALRKAINRGDIDAKNADTLLDEFRNNVAEELLARGAGAQMIRRAPYLIEGYERADVVGNFEATLNSTAGMLSKAIYALRQYKHMKKVPARTRKWATSYIAGTLRNMARADRLSGDARALASLWYLGFNAIWMAINHTQPYVFGVAELSRHIKNGALSTGKEKGALRQISTAEKDLLTGNLTAPEKALWHDPRVKVQIEETVMAEMAGSDSGVGGKISRGLHTASRVSMAHGHKVEVLNRKMMILAAYRTFRQQGQEHGAALNQALEVNSAVNIDMGRYNLPGYAAHSSIGRTMFALQSFIQHAWQYMYYRSTSGQSRDQKAILRLLFAMALLGGLPAGAPGSDELDDLIMKLFGYSPKLAMKGWLRKEAKEYGSVGELLEGFVWHGIPGMLGGSVTGSVQFRIPIISSVINGDNAFRSVGGAVGGLATKGWNAAGAIEKGNYGRALEYAAPTALANPLSGIRQATEGVKTSHGKPVFYKGQPLKMTGTEAAVRAMGMQPARTTDIAEVRGMRMDLQAQWNEKRQLALDRYRTDKALKHVQEFNKALRGSQAEGLVNPITVDSLRQQAKPDKKLTRWERDKGFE